MKKLFILPILGMLLFSCSKKELIQVNGTVHGYVIDINTGQFLDAVTVTFRQGEDSATVVTDASGYYSISGISAGEVHLSYKKSGYATYLLSSWIDPLSNNNAIRGGGDVPYYEQESIELTATGASISGVLLKEVGPTNDLRPAANYAVILYNDFYNDEGILPAAYTTITNSRGEFSFTDLPVNTEMVVYFPATSDIDNYYSENSLYITTPLSGSTEVRQTIDRDNLGIYLISSNLWNTNGSFVQNFAVNGSIVLNFSTNISKELTESQGYISLSGIVLDYDSDLTYSGSTLTITPPIDLGNDATYTLEFIVYSDIPGDSDYASMAFHTVE
jgi:hypothetical protein